MINRIGAYITSHNQPLFLRMSMLQILAQTLKPQVIVIHQNNHTPEYSWVIADLIRQAEQQGIKTINIVNNNLPESHDWYLVPLQALIDEGCDIFVRIEQDDIYYDHHVATAAQLVIDGADLVITRHVGLLKLPKKSPYSYQPLMDFSQIHAGGGMSGSMVCSRKFVEANIADIRSYREPGLWEDQITARHTAPRFTATTHVLSTDNPSTCYVAHGNNASSAHWVQD